MNIRLIKKVIGILMGSFIFFGNAYGQNTKPVDTIQLKSIQVAPHTYFVQGFAEMGSSTNQNFISNAGFVVTPAGIVVVDALGSPTLAQKLIAEIKKITPKKISRGDCESLSCGSRLRIARI
ncbi:hypothetical protein [Polynucleobacter campilacus]|uniref:hypothetical protein n=1 Tax=Polynucleobacter campilacus TaxID=1743163 RepID=UPI001F0B1232|nr:hypothetical protein [Polynucleobacter campilacus]